MEEPVCTINAELLGGYLRRIVACVERLSDEQIWWRPNSVTNSIGNNILHVDGNLSQWILAALGGAPYQRHRSEEFSAAGTHTKKQLLSDLGIVIERCQATIRGLSQEDLKKRHTIQGSDVDGLYAVIHAVEHASYHAGQIIHITKEILGPQAEIEFFPQHRNE